LGKVGEFGFIRKIQEKFGVSRFPVIQGIGDDAAILRQQSGQDLLASTDLLVEGIHFNLSCHRLKDIGYRAAVANLSDIAAMGGKPEALLIGIAIPPAFTLPDLKTFYDGLMEPCRQHDVMLMGGDTSASQSQLFLSITVFGSIKQGRSLRRSGAKISDLIYVTGSLGDSLAGLRLLQNPVHTGPSYDRKKKRRDRILTQRHLRPTPRVDVGQFLVQSQLAHAAIDLSDGFSGDLRHICQASRVGAEIWTQDIPISPECRSLAQDLHEPPLDLALQGGEDYELLFTAPANRRQKIEAISHSLKVPITCIGEIRSQRYGVRLKLEDGSSRKGKVTSYHHFHDTPITSID